MSSSEWRFRHPWKGRVHDYIFQAYIPELNDGVVYCGLHALKDTMVRFMKGVYDLCWNG